jgi:hypothetical protein
MINPDEAKLMGTAIENAARNLNQLIGHAATRGLLVQANLLELRFFGAYAPTPFIDVDVRVRLEDLEDAPSAEGEAGPEPAPVDDAPLGFPAEDVTKAGTKKV